MRLLTDSTSCFSATAQQENHSEHLRWCVGRLNLCRSKQKSRSCVSDRVRSALACFHSVILFQSVSEPAVSRAFSSLTRVYFTFLLITTCFQPDFLQVASSHQSAWTDPAKKLLQSRCTELMFSFCSVFLCSEECNQKQSGASGVLLECLLVREVSQEKKERAGPETPPGAE